MKDLRDITWVHDQYTIFCLEQKESDYNFMSTFIYSLYFVGSYLIEPSVSTWCGTLQTVKHNRERRIILFDVDIFL